MINCVTTRYSGFWRASLRRGEGPFAAVAGKSTLNRLELSKGELSRYHKISCDPAAVETLLVDLFLEAYRSAPEEIILGLDATDDPLHGDQKGRFFHGYYDNYCYLPLYIFCGRHLLVAKLRRANIDASAGAMEEVARLAGQIRARWPKVRIVLRADSGFAREELMAWCEANGVDYLFGLARSKRLQARIAADLAKIAEHSCRACELARRFRDFTYKTVNSWSRARRVIGKTEWLPPTLTKPRGRVNPRFIVTSLSREACAARTLYEQRYCARGEM